ncbi:hypothetical protein [Sphingobacterium multivorum]|uniref:hypothetical protein n=1 Tax=Sphingobacterium multivorum TaxID=28454 RepID=UPI00301B15F6
MENFKIIAIRPSKGCHRRFLKNLTPGRIYPLYGSYSFFDDERKELVKSKKNAAYFSNNPTIPANFFSRITKDGNLLNINISAIAGKNGSGKSSIIELLFASIYLLSVNKGFLEPNLQSLSSEKIDIQNSELREIEEIIEKEKNEISEMLTKYNAFDKKLQNKFSNLSSLEQKLRETKTMFDFLNKDNKKKASEIKQFGKQLKAQIFYEIDENVFCLDLKYNNINENVDCTIYSLKNFDIQNEATVNVDLNSSNLSKYFFYTIAVNYSHYALNSEIHGMWLDSLFHKNDGYQTPIVINPMRTKGIFDINSEISFAKYRLLTNVLQGRAASNSSNDNIYITDKHSIKSVIFTLNWEKIKRIPKFFGANRSQEEKRNAKLLLDSILREFLSEEEYVICLKASFPLRSILLNYILNKAEKIPEKYPWFSAGSLDISFLKKIKDDSSHVTFKFKQAINFLKYNIIKKRDGFFNVKRGQIKHRSKIEFRYSLNELLTWMGNPSGFELIYMLPPSLFNIDFELLSGIASRSYFSELSSGEQQLVHSIQSAIYHLNNIQSIHSSLDNRIKYRAINLVYDEIELYFHPEYQRKFINYLLTALERLYLGGENKVKTINIMLLTHSPFILSDIPSENIMLLNLQARSESSIPMRPKSETFAANINDLLADSFFLNDTLIGEFAEDIIDNLINRIKNDIHNENDYKIIELVGDTFLKINLETFFRSKK